MRLAPLLPLLLLACSNQTPQDDYEAFRERTATRRAQADADAGTQASCVEDVRGLFLVRAVLIAGIDLGLKIELSGSDEPPPVELTAKIWLARQDAQNDPPLLTTTTTLEEDGSFVIVAHPLELGTDVVNTEEPVRANVILNARTMGPDSWCGVVEGSVSSPLNIGLDGSTFFAQRDPDETGVSTDLPFRCGAGCGVEVEPDAGVEGDAGMASDGGVDAAPRPESPDLTGVASERRDLTGHWILNAQLAVNLQLWLTLVSGPDEASVDGLLRRVTDPLVSPPLATFSAEVDEDGYFEVWLPGLQLDSPLGAVDADILLGAASVPDAICGAAAGAVRSPFMLDLAGSTFYAQPWVPGSDIPADLPNACPEE